MPTIEENIQRFEELLGSVQRNGMDKLMNYIRKKTDFYSAPASTRFHLACEGGLLQHSLNVYDCLVVKKENPIWQGILAGIPDENSDRDGPAARSVQSKLLYRRNEEPEDL